jgi:tetratricopeptide (TPR) repeat protein
MLLRKLLDPDETARRRRLRARIVRRNRIRKEIAQGLEPTWHRRTPATARTVHDYGWNPLEDGTAAVADQRRVENEGNALAFLVRAATPTDGSRAKARARSPAVMEGVQRVPPRFRNRVPLTEDQRHGVSPGNSGDAGSTDTRRVVAASGEGMGGNGVARPFNDRVRMRWKDVLERILIQRHEQILAKDANRAWRQERLALLLFERKQYASARDHFVKAITLGSKSSLCWRRLAQCHWFDCIARHDWDALWDAKAAFEQALRHVEMACNPYVLLDYARVLEVLGSYEAALTACASLLTTFPRFAFRTTVAVRFVVLQRYQLMSSGEPMEAADKERAIGKCLDLTKTLLLDKELVDSAQYPLVLYTHVRLNELLFETAITRGDASGTAVAKAAKTSVDVSTEELFKLSGSHGIGIISPNMDWKTWRLHSDTYLCWADHFQRMNENIAAADALARALELMEIPLEKRQPLKASADENARRKIALYTAMAFNYYQSNQMERAIRAMETIFQLDPFIETVRQSLAAWFPAKWKCVACSSAWELTAPNLIELLYL